MSWCWRSSSMRRSASSPMSSPVHWSARCSSGTRLTPSRRQVMTVITHERFHPSEPVEFTESPTVAAGAGAAAITLSGLEKSFDANRVLRGINLHIPAGQFVAVIGKSGCGKSTLLRILMGLDEPTGGEISFEGADGAEIQPNARIVFQEPRLLPWLSVAD